jgi:hypothetical protein
LNNKRRRIGWKSRRVRMRLGRRSWKESDWIRNGMRLLKGRKRRSETWRIV